MSIRMLSTLLVSFLFVGSLLGFADAATILNDQVITADTTWREDIYQVTNLTVTNGATLTIAGGTTLNVNGAVTVMGN